MEKYKSKKDEGIVFSKGELHCFYYASKILKKADLVASEYSNTTPFIDLTKLNLILDRLYDHIKANDGKLPFDSEYKL